MNEVVQSHQENKAKTAWLKGTLSPFVWGGLGVLVLIGLFIVGRHDFILFHCMTELFSIAVAWAVFLLVWNARGFIKNDALLFLGIAYLFIGFVDLLHTLAYKGMEVFDAHWGANLPTQLWMSARFMEGVALLAVAIFLGRRVKLLLSLATWLAVTTLMLLMIFYWRVFPVCFEEGAGLTTFKKTGEYVICLLLLLALVVLYRKRDMLDFVVYRLLALSMLLAIATELTFTLYMDVYGYANMTGHILKVISFMLIYLALIHTGLKRPFALLSADLEQEKGDLRKSEGLLQKIFDTLPIGLWFADKNGKLLRGNPAGVRIWGAEPLVDISEYGVFKARQIPSRKEITPDDWALTRTIRDKATVVDELLEIDAFDGRKKRILNSTFPILDDNGEVQGAIVVNRDVTAREQAEDALRESEARLRSYVAHAPYGLFIADETGRYLEVNPAACSITGYSEQELLAMGIPDLLPPETAEEGKAHFQRLIEMGASIGELPFRHKSGEVRHWMVSAVRLTPTRLMGYVQDITERKQIELYRDIHREVLQVLNEPVDLRSAIERIIDVLKSRTGLDAVGIRIEDGEDFPYFAQKGFADDFLETENSLIERGRDGGVCRDKNGNVCLECTCGLVLTGKTDPDNPLFTRGGSAWTNDSFPILDVSEDQDPRHHPRNECIHQGYASIALIPVRNKDRIVGLLQFNDRQKNRFSLALIEQLEGIAAHLGEALLRKRAEEGLQEANSRLEKSARDARKLAKAAELANRARVSFLQT